MVAAAPPYVEVDGQAVAPGAWGRLALLSHGHFTVLQVRAGGCRGLTFHLERLDTAHRELYGKPLGGERVRARIRQALAAFLQVTGPPHTCDAPRFPVGGLALDTPQTALPAESSPGTAPVGAAHGCVTAAAVGAAAMDATVRVIATDPAGDGPGEIIVVVGPPADAPPTPRRLMSVHYTRPFPHIKHLGTFGQLEHARLAHRRGFDEALLTWPDGTIAEGARTNIGFLAGETVTWPDAPCLTGVTMALLERTTDSTRAPVRLEDLARYDGAVVTNSRGLAPVAAIDDHQFAGSTFTEELSRRYHAIPHDTI
ncbi:aminotransferase class IV [Frankia sp. R82]|uniref:aminotransferase class IV n=1 Tax=Frankia sp. R82 TaxID=2950553 RepID=UPI00204496A3|nr:aminotransferase class IV [Frankia sp. R82]MCM3884325.1 aminotransferase class IV [Frankia sp. R82]